MQAPFPYFGGKRQQAQRIWAALGDVGGYVEPFAGSLAVLLGRPKPSDTETCKCPVTDCGHNRLVADHKPPVAEPQPGGDKSIAELALCVRALTGGRMSEYGEERQAVDALVAACLKSPWIALADREPAIGQIVLLENDLPGAPIVVMFARNTRSTLPALTHWCPITHWTPTPPTGEP